MVCIYVHEKKKKKEKKEKNLKKGEKQGQECRILKKNIPKDSQRSVEHESRKTRDLKGCISGEKKEKGEILICVGFFVFGIF